MPLLPSKEKRIERQRAESLSQAEAESADPGLLTKPQQNETPPTEYDLESQRVSDAQKRRNKAKADWLIQQAAEGKISPEDLLHKK